MSQHYPADFLRMLRNDIPIDQVIVDLLNLEVQKDPKNNQVPLPPVLQFPYGYQSQNKFGQMLRLREKLQSDRYGYHGG